MATLPDQGFLELGDLRLEYRMVGPRPHDAPTLILLHEGLGSAGMWGDFPEKLSAATGCGVFAWSRVGYGHSSSGETSARARFHARRSAKRSCRGCSTPSASDRAC